MRSRAAVVAGEAVEAVPLRLEHLMAVRHVLLATALRPLLALVAGRPREEALVGQEDHWAPSTCII